LHKRIFLIFNCLYWIFQYYQVEAIVLFEEQKQHFEKGIIRMSTDSWLLVALLVAVFGLLDWRKTATRLAIVSRLITAMTLQSAPLEKMLSGFSKPEVISLAG
jgi:hypothetical protein